MTKSAFQVGDRVQPKIDDPDGYDQGTVLAVAPGVVSVRWDLARETYDEDVEALAALPADEDGSRK